MNKNVFIVKRLSALLVVIAVITFNSAVSTASDQAQKFREYVSSGNYFKCSIPTDWSIYPPGFGLSEEEKKVYGVTLIGPKGISPISPLISIHYYAPENLLHKTMDVFIRRHSQSIFGLETEGKSYGNVQEIKIADREAKTFERIDIRFIEERVINPAKVPIYEKFITIPARSGEGFYVLKLSVPAEIKDEYKGLFDVTANSFLPEN
jgi:hypothetical protein